MGSLLASTRGKSVAQRSNLVLTLDDYAASLNDLFYNGSVYSDNRPITSYGTQPTEEIQNNVHAYVSQAYTDSGVVFAVMAVRALVFSSIRFRWRREHKGRPSEYFGTQELSILETPWPGGTTQDLLLRMELDVSIAGNSYWTRQGSELIRLRPDWTSIILEPRMLPIGPGGKLVQVGHRRIGYAYYEGGIQYGKEPALFTTKEVAHYAPSPDPLATYRGMSWLTPVLQEIQNDKSMLRHKAKFFQNAATPNLSVSLDKAISREQFEAFIAKVDSGYRGLDNAYKTMYLGGGADVKVIGANFQQMDFKSIQGHGETRIAAAGGVPPIIVGLSEGLEAATYSNYGQARRRFADGTMHPLWQNAAGSLAPLLTSPGKDARLAPDARDVPFLREDRKDAAEIEGRKVTAIRTLIDAGFVPESIVTAVESEDLTLLVHSGLYTVQLQPPGTTTPDPTTPATPATPTTPAKAPAAKPPAKTPATK